MISKEQHCALGLTNPRYEEEEPLSNCCGAEMIGSDEDPICSECREHCEPFEIDPTEAYYAKGER